MERPPRLTGDERLTGAGADALEALLLDFWGWAFSDLRSNNLRGVLAEWIVAKLLQIEPPVRESWAPWDLSTPDGVRIEVKSGAYLQTWAREGDRPSRIVFGGLRGSIWDPDAGYAPERTYNADLYVFAIQIETDPRQWNALDLGQWRFYLIPREMLASYDTRSLTLSTVRSFATEVGAADLPATTFQQRAMEMIAAIVARKQTDG